MAKKKPTKKTTRSPNDPRVLRIVHVFDRMMSSEARDGGFLNMFMHDILGDGCDRPMFDGWSDEAARATVIAYVLNCPETRLVELDEVASDRHMWIIGWDFAHDYSKLTMKDGAFDGFDYEHLGRATFLRSKELLEAREKAVQS